MLDMTRCESCQKPTPEKWLLNLSRYNSVAEDRRRISARICPDCAQSLKTEILKTRAQEAQKS